MPFQLRNFSGVTEAVIDDNCGISKFYAIANTLSKDLNVIFINQVDDAQTLEWDFEYSLQYLTLHYNIYGGVSITPRITGHTSETNDKAVIEIASFLEKKIF